MRKHVNQAGETIVEVLIAMAVVSLVIGGAYATVNRTLANARQAQERSEALKLAEGQIESLKGLDTASVTPLKSGTNCLTRTAAGIEARTGDKPECNNQGLGGLYKVALDYRSTPSQHFVVGITWDSLTGNQKNNVELTYRTTTQ